MYIKVPAEIDKNSFLNLAWRMITERLAIISGKPYGYSKRFIFLRAKTTSSGMRAKGRYFPKYLTRSGSSFFEKKKNGVDLIKNVVIADVITKIKTLVIINLDSISKTIKA